MRHSTELIDNVMAAIGSIVALTSDQTIALRLLESLLILVPIWLAVTQYIIRNLSKPSENLEGQVPRRAIAIAFIYLSYFILILSLTGIRSALSPVIDSDSLLAVLDLIILFIVVVALILYISIIDLKFDDLFELFDISGDRFDVIAGMSFLSLIISLLMIFLVVYWLLVGGLMLDLLAWILDRIYIRW